MPMHALIPWAALALAPAVAPVNPTAPAPVVTPAPATVAPTPAPVTPTPVRPAATSVASATTGAAPVTTSAAPGTLVAPATTSAAPGTPVTTSAAPAPTSAAPGTPVTPAPTSAAPGTPVTTSAAPTPVMTSIAPGAATGVAAPTPSKFVPPGDPAKLAEAPVDGGRSKWKPGTGLEVGTQDRRFTLQFGLMAQLQVPIHHTPEIPAMTMDGEPTPAVNDVTLQFRRARMSLGGNVFTQHIKYKIQFTMAPVEMGFKDGVPHRVPILDWFFTFDRSRDATLQVGQYKVPYNHQRVLRVVGMQFVDRSAANNEFTMDRDIGLDIRSKDVGGLGKLRYYAGVYLGDGIARYGASDSGFMYLGRIEVLPFGQYDDLEEADHERSLEPKLLIGGAYAFIDRDPHDNHGFFGAIPADGGTTSTHNATADVNFRWAGFSFEGAFFWRKGWRQPGKNLDMLGDPIPVVAARNGLGYFTQAGYLLPRLPVELGARWGQIMARGDAAATSLRDSNELGGVLNYYFARHALKLQLDYLKLWNPSLGVRYGTDQVRLQLQVTF
jgi:phosphate-selective porin OprO/OprP